MLLTPLKFALTAKAAVHTAAFAALTGAALGGAVVGATGALAAAGAANIRRDWKDRREGRGAPGGGDYDRSRDGGS